jgi:hypothetical protein
MKHIKLERIPLKGHPELNEKWVQDQIAAEPSILGLGDLELKSKEVIHPQAGRLDILLRDAESGRRYEVEVQLGRTDESHIIRTLEYWDIERKRYPQYDHVAVIVAEEITSRFLNVIALFNGSIPLVAIQMHAFRVGEDVSLVFTTVLSERQLGMDDDTDPVEATDRNYWEAKVGKPTMEIVDDIVEVIRTVESGMSPKYNKHYVGLTRKGQPFNFALLIPKKEWVRVLLRLERSEDMVARLEQASADVEYDAKNQRYKVRLLKGDVAKHEALLTEMFKASMEFFAG